MTLIYYSFGFALLTTLFGFFGSSSSSNFGSDQDQNEVNNPKREANRVKGLTARQIGSSLSISSGLMVNRLILLVLLFFLAAFVYLLFDFYFLGLSYLIVYSGAIAILFLFVIMTLNIRGIGGGTFSYSVAIATATLATATAATLATVTAITLTLITLHDTYTYFSPQNVGTILFSNSNLSDIYHLGQFIYLAFPLSLVLIAIALWIVLVGLIKLLIA